MFTERTTNELIKAWREMGPVQWAESTYGWIEDGQPINLEKWQKAAIGAWWDHRDTCTTFAISNVKKTGKTFTNAVLLAWRWLALPGQHFAVGNDLDQSQSRQFAMIAQMCKQNPHLAENCTLGKSELVYLPTGSTLTALSNDAAGNAGANFITTSHTEAWAIIYEQGMRAYEEMTPPPGKKYGFPNLRICDSYQGFEGETKIWHDLVDRGLTGKKISKDWNIYKAEGLILFHAEGEQARLKCFRGTPEEAEDYYNEQRRTLRPNTFTRYHANQRTAAESQFLPEGTWSACYDRSVRPVAPGERVRLVLGADASTSRDYTSLVGTVYDQQTNTVDVRFVKVWRPKKIAGLRLGKPTIDIDATIGQMVLDMAKAGQVDSVVCDNYQLHTCVISWQKAGIRVTELAQNNGRIESDQSLYDTVVARGVRHYNHPDLNEAIHNAVAVETPRGFRLAKEKTSKKIDAAVALSMSAWGALKTKASGGMVETLPSLYSDIPLSDVLMVNHQWVYAPGANRSAHPPGVTWRNCRHRNKGCEACIAELEADGYYMQQEEELQMSLARGAGRPMSEEEANKELFNLLNMDWKIAQEVQNDINERKAKQTFKRAVEKRLRDSEGTKN